MDYKKITIYFNEGNGLVLNDASFQEGMNAWRATTLVRGYEKDVLVPNNAIKYIVIDEEAEF